MLAIIEFEYFICLVAVELFDERISLWTVIAILLR